MKQFILKIPEGTSAEDFSPAMKKAVKSVNAVFPSGRIVGTKAVDGYELKLIIASTTGEALNSLFEYGVHSFDKDGEPITTDLGLQDWAVLAEEGLQIDQGPILDYMVDVVSYDQEGDEISSEPVVDVTNKLQTYAGRKWTY